MLNLFLYSAGPNCCYSATARALRIARTHQIKNPYRLHQVYGRRICDILRSSPLKHAMSAQQPTTWAPRVVERTFSDTCSSSTGLSYTSCMLVKDAVAALQNTGIRAKRTSSWMCVLRRLVSPMTDHMARRHPPRMFSPARSKQL